MPTEKRIYVRFYEELNDFLPKEFRKKEFEYSFTGNPSVKDTIEAIGVPHPEVDLILANGLSVDFDYNIKSDDRISVYPQFELLNISPLNKLRPMPLRKTKFILDINLGKLSTKLRMFGFDSLYKNSYTDLEIINIAEDDKRIILTRDQGLLKNKKVSHGYWVRNTNPKNQIHEIIDKFDLIDQIKPFTICMNCNGKIIRIDKEKIINTLPPKVKRHYKDYFQCSDCAKVYWEGTHYLKMLAEVNTLKSEYLSKNN